MVRGITEAVMENHSYHCLPSPSSEEVASALSSNDGEVLKCLVIGAALHWDDPAASVDLCMQLARHPDEQVRGNAILGFGHIARRFRDLPEGCKCLVESALFDASTYVTGQANAAADDLIFFLGWRIRGME